MRIGERIIGETEAPFVIAEIGINHEGSFKKAIQMIDDAHRAGAECVKFQWHIMEDEMVASAKDVVPGNADQSIWEIMERCMLSTEEHKKLKEYTEKLGLIYLCTPFSRAAANELERLGVSAYKIGSGECNNYPLIKHIAAFEKPVILSTGMNDIPSIQKAVKILEDAKVDYALLHCTSMYPTPYDKVRLAGITDLHRAFPKAVLGLSDHSLGNYTCFASIPFGARILEKHFTSDPTWPGPDVPISITPFQLQELVQGSRAIFQALGGRKEILKEEQPVIDFAYACVVSTRKIQKGERFSKDNLWVKRPGTGEIKAEAYESLLGKVAKTEILEGVQVRWNDIEGS